MREVAKQLPQYDYVYYGDTANLPYGDKDEETIYELAKTALTALFARDCSLVIVACNTVSAESLRRLQDTFLKEEYPERRVLGVIVPTLEELIKIAPKRAILLATTRTVQSQKYAVELEKLKSALSLLSVATPALVPLIEQHKLPEAVHAAAKELIALGVGEGDVVILGCTHYILMKDTLRELFEGVIFISQDELLPKKLESYLSNHPEITKDLSNEGQRNIILTEHREDYDQLTAQFLKGAYLPSEEQAAY